MAYETGILLKTGTNEMEIVEFYLDESGGAGKGSEGEIRRVCYGINVAKVLEIIRKPHVNKVPLSPPAVIGTFILRNKVIPLIDLTMQLGKPRLKQQGTPLAIITEFNRTTMAFEVSGVNRIHRLAWSEIEPAEAVLGNFSSSVTGIVKFEDRNVLLLDMEKILAELDAQYCVEDRTETEQRENPPNGSQANQLPGLDSKSAAAPPRAKALIADDSSSIRTILTRMLEKDGFLVTSAGDGEKALTMLMELKERSQKENHPINHYVEILISDIEMPKMDGYSLCQAVKKDPVLGTLPVILFSSLINDRLLHKGRSVGADEQITKPETANLTGSARRLIAQSKARMEALVNEAGQTE
ncbi:MAG: chemotaxis protein [Syntrophobacteraceae bacterium]|nr:chemotaxis protein [Syntrophobacteraceae bacterium]